VIAGIAVIARHRRNRKRKSLPQITQISADRKRSGHEEASMRKIDGGPKSRNMSRYPIVLKDYGIVAYFARGFRYNEQALVYSGLLACNAGLASRNAAFTAAYRLKDRPQ
jgi:hypothetical protein